MTIEDLANAAEVLRDAAAARGASNHGVREPLYGAHPDGNELDAELRRHGSPAPTGG